MNARLSRYLVFLGFAAIALCSHVYYLSFTVDKFVDAETLHIVLLGGLLWAGTDYYFDKVKKKVLRTTAFLVVVAMTLCILFLDSKYTRLVQLLTLIPLFLADVIIYITTRRHITDE